MEKGYTIPVLDHGYVRYIDHMGSDERIVEAARISYKSPSKGEEGDKKLLRYLMREKHTSPFEMCKVTFNIKMPIFVMRQYVRHRMQNLNEVSARYTELPNEFYIPTKWRKQDTKNRQGSLQCQDYDEPNCILPYHDGKVDKDGSPGVKLNIPLNKCFTDSLTRRCEEAYSTYQMMLDAGVAREMARMVLPVNIYTEIYCCWDLKNLLHFIALRDDSHAQFEIQQYGKAIKDICKELFPWTMEIYEQLRTD